VILCGVVARTQRFRVSMLARLEKLHVALADAAREIVDLRRARR
jgi:hypothetical protein